MKLLRLLLAILLTPFIVLLLCLFYDPEYEDSEFYKDMLAGER